MSDRLFFWRVQITTRKNHDRKNKRYSCLADGGGSDLAGTLRPEKKRTVIWPAMFFSGFKLQPEKITTGKKGTVVWPSVGNWKKLSLEKKGTVFWLSVGGQNTKHNTHHRNNNQQDEQCHPTLQRLCPLSLHGWSSGTTNSAGSNYNRKKLWPEKKVQSSGQPFYRSYFFPVVI